MVLVDGAGAEVPVAVVDVTGVRARFEKMPGDADDALMFTVKTARVWSPAAERDAGRRALLSRVRADPGESDVPLLRVGARAEVSIPSTDPSAPRVHLTVTTVRVGAHAEAAFRIASWASAATASARRRGGRRAWSRSGPTRPSRLRRRLARSDPSDSPSSTRRCTCPRLETETRPSPRGSRFPRVARGGEARDATSLVDAASDTSSGAPPPRHLLRGTPRASPPLPHFSWTAFAYAPSPPTNASGRRRCSPHGDGEEKPAAPSRVESLPVFGRGRDAREGDRPRRAIVRGGRSPRLRHSHPRNHRASGGRRARVRIRVRVDEGGDDGVVRRGREPRGGRDRGGRDGASSAASASATRRVIPARAATDRKIRWDIAELRTPR